MSRGRRTGDEPTRSSLAKQPAQPWPPSRPASARTVRRAGLACGLAAFSVTGPPAPPAAAASTSSPVQIRSVYRAVLTAEYFGPSTGVCGRLSPSGRASFEAGGGRTCAHAFAAQQHVLRHKVPGVDNSGYTPTQWRTVVDQVMTDLKVTVTGSRAAAIGPSGIPGRTTLVKAGGRWLFTSYPPSIQP